MIFQNSVLALLLSFSSTAAFTSPAAFVHPSTTEPSSSALYISSWGTKGPPARWSDTLERENPAEKVQAYLTEPEAVEARSNIDDTCLVSGLMKPGITSDDQFLFDLLNHEDSAFEFKKIVAHCNDPKVAKKRLLSRSARYTGLLDKLDFQAAASENALPTAEQLDGVKTWIAYLQGGDLLAQLEEIAATAEECTSLQNVAVLLTDANELDASASEAALKKLQAISREKFAYTVVAVGKLEDHPEGREAYMFEPFGTTEGVLPAKAVFSRQESYRMVTELLQLECGKNKALSFAEVYNVNATNVKLVKGLREAGYARPQEIDHMIRKGPEAYLKAIEEWNTKNPDAAKGYTTNAWWEQEQFQKSRRRSDEKMAAEEEKEKDVRLQEIEAIAKEWVKREYFRESMAGTIENDMTEEEYGKTVWDRAMLEGDMKYRQKMGEIVDEEALLADFKVRQKRKQEAMLKKAKQELADILGEDPLPPDFDDEPKPDKKNY